MHWFGRPPVVRGGGGGVLNKFLSGEASPRGPTPYPFFHERGTPFVHLLHLVLNFASLLTAVNTLSFK